MKRTTDSVAKGGSSVALARMLGMLFSFLLFLILARHSTTDAGLFRTVVTYILIAESLGMLGLHRWLANEIAPKSSPRWLIFLATNAFTLAITCVLSLIYIGIANANLYSAALNQGLLLGALAVIPSGIFACVQSALIGIGKSHNLGQLNMTENILRCVVSIGLIYMNQPIISIIWVFVLTRWGIALYGFYQLKVFLDGESWHISPEIIAKISKQAPKFAVIIFSFLMLRNAGLLMLAAVSHESETGIFAAAYQLLDLILLVPSVLAVTTSHVFSNKAIASKAALNKTSIQLMTITSLALFPLIAITAGLASHFLLFLYGSKYAFAAQASLIILMLAAALMMIDQVLSQIMLARKDYHDDMLSILAGGYTAFLFTLLLSYYHGATGAATALLIAITVTVLIRLVKLKIIFPSKLLFLSLWKQTLASVIVFVTYLLCIKLTMFQALFDSQYRWILSIPVGLILYVILMYALGGMNRAQRHRMRQFLFHH